MRSWLVLCALTTTASAEVAGDGFEASLRGRIGSITAPFYTTAHPVVRSELQAYSMILDGWARIRPPWSAGVRIAIATSSVEEPAGSYTADYSLGNPLAYVEYTTHLRPALIAHAHVGLGVPLAGSGSAPSLVRNRVLAASDALEGWRSTELYQPGTLPLVLEATLEHLRPAWHARARAKLAAFVHVTDSGLPAEADTRPLGVVPSTEAELAWRARPWLSVGIGAHLAVVAARPFEPIRDVGRSGPVALGVVPHLELTRGRLAFQLDLLVAVAGPLDGSIGLGAGIAWRHPATASRSSEATIPRGSAAWK
jgi:hypothetical protein